VPDQIPGTAVIRPQQTSPSALPVGHPVAPLDYIAKPVLCDQTGMLRRPIADEQQPQLRRDIRSAVKPCAHRAEKELRIPMAAIQTTSVEKRESVLTSAGGNELLEIIGSTPLVTTSIRSLLRNPFFAINCVLNVSVLTVIPPIVSAPPPRSHGHGASVGEKDFAQCSWCSASRDLESQLSTVSASVLRYGPPADVPSAGERMRGPDRPFSSLIACTPVHRPVHRQK